MSRQVVANKETSGPSVDQRAIGGKAAPTEMNEKGGALEMDYRPAVEAVRARYADVGTRQRLFQKAQKTIFGMSAEGADLTVYSEAGTVRKIVANFLGEGGRSTTELYYWNQQLDFVFETSVIYKDRNLAAAGEPPASETESRLYFENGKLVWWVTGRERTAVGGERYAEEEQSLLETSRLLRDAAGAAGTTLQFSNGKFRAQ